MFVGRQCEVNISLKIQNVLTHYTHKKWYNTYIINNINDGKANININNRNSMNLNNAANNLAKNKRNDTMNQNIIPKPWKK